jgi:E3 ubiquitin-protein ligase DOA10
MDTLTLAVIFIFVVFVGYLFKQYNCSKDKDIVGQGQVARRFRNFFNPRKPIRARHLTSPIDGMPSEVAEYVRNQEVQEHERGNIREQNRLYEQAMRDEENDEYSNTGNPFSSADPSCFTRY